MSLSGNKGEWSEVYALFKLLADGILTAGDESLNKVEELFYPIIRIIRQEKNDTFIYQPDQDIVLISGSSNQQVRIPVLEFEEKARLLLSQIKQAKGAFTYPELDDFLEQINCRSLKAKSSSKTDIRIMIHDRHISQSVELGFSVKSQLGGDSTLLNAGRTTNFIYKIEEIDLTDKEIDDINNIDSRSKIRDRILNIRARGGRLIYSKMENPVFQNNLVLIDSLMPNIISELLLRFNEGKSSSIKGLTTILLSENTLDFNISFAHNFYEYKIKRFLTDVALGMMPSKVWNGLYDATGGYLVIKSDGEIVCYHIYNKNQFEDYLFHNTKMETASSTRHGFGSVFKENGELFFKLNLQIRFK